MCGCGVLSFAQLSKAVCKPYRPFLTPIIPACLPLHHVPHSLALAIPSGGGPAPLVPRAPRCDVCCHHRRAQAQPAAHALLFGVPGEFYNY